MSSLGESGSAYAVGERRLRCQKSPTMHLSANNQMVLELYSRLYPTSSPTHLVGLERKLVGLRHDELRVKRRKPHLRQQLPNSTA